MMVGSAEHEAGGDGGFRFQRDPGGAEARLVVAEERRHLDGERRQAGGVDRELGAGGAQPAGGLPTR